KVGGAAPERVGLAGAGRARRSCGALVWEGRDDGDLHLHTVIQRSADGRRAALEDPPGDGGLPAGLPAPGRRRRFDGRHAGGARAVHARAAADRVPQRGAAGVCGVARAAAARGGAARGVPAARRDRDAPGGFHGGAERDPGLRETDRGWGGRGDGHHGGGAGPGPARGEVDAPRACVHAPALRVARPGDGSAVRVPCVPGGVREEGARVAQRRAAAALGRLGGERGAAPGHAAVLPANRGGARAAAAGPAAAAHAVRHLGHGARAGPIPARAAGDQRRATTAAAGRAAASRTAPRGGGRGRRRRRRGRGAAAAAATPRPAPQARGQAIRRAGRAGGARGERGGSRSSRARGGRGTGRRGAGAGKPAGAASRREPPRRPAPRRPAPAVGRGHGRHGRRRRESNPRRQGWVAVMKQLYRHLVAGSAFVLLGVAPAAAQNGDGPHAVRDRDAVAAVPFGLGERLTYKVTLGMFGGVGNGAMEVLELDTIHGRPTYRLRFTLNGGVLFAKVDDTLQSWLDVSDLISRRFEQNQKEVNYERHRTFDFFPEQGIWKRLENGQTGELATPEPLDDVSFIYFIRTIPLEVGKTYTFDRYYKDSGNPVIVKVLRKETVTVPAGTFETVVVRPI